MGFDAVVYCNCFETGRLREPPPPGSEPRVADDGSLVCGCGDVTDQLAFDQWVGTRACEHNGGILMHQSLGNASRIAGLRTELERSPTQFPNILSKVIFSGTHCGDHLDLSQVANLESEVMALAEFRGSTSAADQALRFFQSQMSALIECARRFSKPISF